MKRREFIIGAAALGGTALFACAESRTDDERELLDVQKDWKQLLPEKAGLDLSTDSIELSEDAWRKRLTPAQFKVLRDEGTEPSGSSPLDREKRAGIFACAGCGLPLFTSEMKFDSGTGWPSFFTAIPGHTATKTDFKIIWPRTEYHCIRCGGHQGHIFKDGPEPTGERWCNNGVALKFYPAS